MVGRLIIQNGSKFLGNKFLRRIANVNPLIVNYHVVSDIELPYISHLYRYRTIAEFRNDIDFYRSNYRIIGLKEMLDSVSLSKAFPENSLLLTFDDGFREIYDTVAPLLLDQNVPATFFLTSSFIDNKNINHDNKQSLLADYVIKGKRRAAHTKLEKLLNEHGISGTDLKSMILAIPYLKRHLIDQIADLLELDLDQIFESYKPYVSTEQVNELISSGFTIGSHSIDHARFSELSIEEQINQTLDSLDFLATKFDLDYRAFAFPYTDIGVTFDYFNRIEEKVDISFGTQDLMDDPNPFHFQRINGEKYPYSAERNVKSHYFMRVIKSLLKRNEIERTGISVPSV